MASRVLAAVVVAVGFVGCGPGVPTPGVTVEITGSLTDSAGKPIKDVNVYFHPVGGMAQPATLKVGADGNFGGQVVAGEYSWVVAPQAGGKGKAVGDESDKTVKGVPADYQKPSLNRKVTVSSGAKLDLKVG